LWGVVRLRAVWGLAALLLTYRLAVLVPEGAASLKLIDKGVPKETLAALVLLQASCGDRVGGLGGGLAMCASVASHVLTSNNAHSQYCALPRMGVATCTRLQSSCECLIRCRYQHTRRFAWRFLSCWASLCAFLELMTTFL
jgi:hypothetical protein